MWKFLHETWLLWYWAMFTPSRLEQHMDNLLQSRPKKSNKESSKAVQLLIEDPDPRFQTQYLLLLILFSLPLASVIATRGQLLDWLILLFALVSSYIIGLKLLLLGIHMPLFFMLIVVGTKEVDYQEIATTIANLPNLQPSFIDIAVASGIGTVGLAITIIIVRRLAENGHKTTGIIVLFVGSMLSLGSEGWLISYNWVSTTLALVYSVLVVLLITIVDELGLVDIRLDKQVVVVVAGVDIRLDKQVVVVVAGVVASTVPSVVAGIVASTVPSVVASTVPSVVAGIGAGIGVSIEMRIGLGIGLGIGLYIVLGIENCIEDGTGIVRGIVLGIVWGIVGGIVGGIVLGITLGIVGGIVLGIVGGIAGGIAGGIVHIALLPLPLSLLVSFVVGWSITPVRRWRVVISVALALLLLSIAQHGWMALLVGFVVLVGYYRLLLSYPALAIMSLWRSMLLSRTSSTTIATWLRSLPPHIDELVWLPFPLPAHAHILAASFRADTPVAMETLQRMQTSSLHGFRATVRQALPQVTADQLLVTTITELVATTARNHPVLPTLFPSLSATSQTEAYEQIRRDFSGEIATMLPRLHSIGRDVETASSERNLAQRERLLVQSLNNLRLIQGQMTGLNLSTRAINRWRPVVEQWQKIIEKEVAEVQRRLQTQQPQPEPQQQSDNSLFGFLSRLFTGVAPRRDTIAEPVQQSVEAWSDIINPYQIGNPLRKDREYLFKGRKQFSDRVYRQLIDPGRPTLVLHGPRRCGKSSFLLNLPYLLPDNVVPVYLDFQEGGMPQGDADVCYRMARAIRNSLLDQGVKLPDVLQDALYTNPYPIFEDWLDAALPLLGTRRALLCMDEFELLGQAVSSGKVSMELMHALRHLIQHCEQMSFLFCGVRTLEELGPDWSSYFISVQPIEMLYLEPDEAKSLLTEPDPAFNMRYANGVVEHILSLTRCHPYLIQLIGSAMVGYANRHKIRLITLDTLEPITKAALKQGGPAYFQNMWAEYTGTTPEEVAAGQSFLHALAHNQPLPDIHSEAGQAALHRLLRYHTIERTASGYRFEIPLVEQWVREYAIFTRKRPGK